MDNFSHKPARLHFTHTAIATAVLLTLNPAHAAFDGGDNVERFQVMSSAPTVTSQHQYQLGAQVSELGAPSHFDRQLNRATFVWAAPQQAQVQSRSVSKHDIATAHMQRLSGLNASKVANIDTPLVDFHDTGKGAVIARYKQLVQGIEVFNRSYNVLLNRQGQLVAGSGYFADVPHAALNFSALSAFSTPQTAALKAIQNISRSEVQFDTLRTQGGYTWLQVTSANDDELFDNVRVKPVFYPLNNELIAAHYVEVERKSTTSLESDYYSYVVDSNSGKILFKNNLHSHATAYNYRVYADAQSGYPLEGPHGDVIPADGPNQVDETDVLQAPLVSLQYYSSLSTQDPWLSETATQTQGNNVYAYADIVSPQGFSAGDISAPTTSAFTFDYPLDPLAPPTTEGNIRAAIVNLFYMNNFLHDVFYDYGFDEAAGVAQQSNFGRGGVAGDPLEVQAQDYSGLNNANMATPSDGASPRMQMYLYNSKDNRVGIDLGVVGPNGALASSQASQFGPRAFDISAQLARYEDGNNTDSGSIYDGCEVPLDANTISGKIAIIERGSCNFTVKVKNAQDAGAVGAIITNNVNDGTPAPMGGADSTITIGNMGLNFADGQSLYNALNAGSVTVRIFNTNPLKDGTFDNGIIAHEWGHYISNRLVGNSSGLSNFQGLAMGEGWGDFHSLLFIAKAQDAQIAGNSDFTKPYATGTYVEDFYFGIRRVPYTPNQNINPLNFRHITEGAGDDVGLPPTFVGSPHAPGELWASVLWDSYVALINEHGFNTAQDKMMRYLVGGYKMTPNAPLYTEARDALLATIAAESISDYRLVLEAFAKRGMGLGAQSPDRFSENLTGVVESFETQLASYDAKEVVLDARGVSYCTDDGYLDVGETGTLAVQVTNTGSETLSDVPVRFEVLSSQGVSLGDGGVSSVTQLEPFETAASEPISITLSEATEASELQVQVSFPEKSVGDAIVEPASFTTSFVVNVGFEDAPLSNGAQSDDMENAVLSKENLSLLLLKDNPLAKETLRFDNSTQIDVFEQGGVDLGAQALFLNNNAFESDVALVTRPFTVASGSDFNVSFWHYYALEQDWDGAVVEINIDDAGWQDVTDAGGQFSLGYSGQIINNPAQSLSLRQAFTGRNDNQGVLGNQEQISFAQTLAGKQVQLRFRISSDANTYDQGWWIDNLTLSGIASSAFYTQVAGDSQACVNRAPSIQAIASQTVDEGTQVTITAQGQDVDGDALSYQWQQTQGTLVTLSGEQTNTLTFTAPDVSASEVLRFSVTVSDGSLSAEQSAQVTVNNVAAPPPPPPPQPEPDSGGSGGGSLGWLALLSLGALRLFRRK
ncbi:rhombosortase-dependent M36 family metallopeptidase [Pseudoalteromonas sp. SSDWG2]|uniref:rhombosortase-dependent M36 family metallopeptidase n=1 Tax=Pseudoalteromonas sp. SSDWG2 TaxID=3139391 RepID=UPI003BA8CBEC